MKSEDGSKLAAEEVVFGTFLTRLGPITAINREAGEIQIQEVTTKKPLTIRVIADSQLKKMPDMRAMMAPRPADHAAPAPAAADGKGFDIQSAMERLPAGADRRSEGRRQRDRHQHERREERHGDCHPAAGERRFPGADGARARLGARAVWTPSIACTAECWPVAAASACRPCSSKDRPPGLSSRAATVREHSYYSWILLFASLLILAEPARHGHRPLGRGGFRRGRSNFAGRRASSGPRPTRQASIRFPR